MLELYRRLSPGEKTLVWLGVAALFVLLIEWGNQSEGVAAAAQVVAGLGTLVLAMLARDQVREMRETRLAQDRPHVIVDMDHSNSPLVYVILRNIGRGAAKNISFDFSASMEIPEGLDNPEIVPVNEQPYFAQGMDYLAPGAEIPSLWGSMITLAPFLRERGLHEGITITSRYESLEGEQHETRWTVNPLLMARRLSTRRKGVNEIAEATERMSRDLSDVADALHGELQVSTESESQQRQDRTD